MHKYSQGIPRVVNLLCEHSMVNSYVDSLRPVPAHLVEEVAREFQLDDTEPTVACGFFQLAKQSANTEALLENLDELLGRLRQVNAVPFRERKS